ncbi:unnamed protein product [Prunus brigantina]
MGSKCNFQNLIFQSQPLLLEFCICSTHQVSMASLRNLKIKTGTCKRIVKELHSYEKEVEREAAKTADMKEKGADPYDLKQQENVLAESRMMLPDCQKRLEASLADLKGILAELEEEQQKLSAVAFVTFTNVRWTWFSNRTCKHMSFSNPPQIKSHHEVASAIAPICSGK